MSQPVKAIIDSSVRIHIIITKGAKIVKIITVKVAGIHPRDRPRIKSLEISIPHTVKNIPI